jgi:outer membrane protein, multidrug efflux system
LNRENTQQADPGRKRIPVVGALQRTALLLSGLLLAGCAVVGPDYEKPELTLPEKWQEIPDPALLPDEEAIRCWWTLFDDPLLTRLIEEAAAGNLDLLTAVARVREARARLSVTAGSTLPSIDATAAMSRQRNSESEWMGTGETYSSFGLGLDASWEIDLFGRLDRAIEASTADFQASEEDRTDVAITLFAEVARTYLAVRTLQARLAATGKNVDSQTRLLELTRSRAECGLATGLDVARAEQFLASTEAGLPLLRLDLNSAINTLGVLLGRPPGALREELDRIGPIPLPPAQATIGVPADLLRRRPDIRRAERELAAQTARIGLATADLYPRLSLSGAFGLSSNETNRVLHRGSRVWNIGPSLSWNVFDGGRVRRRIDVEDALTEQALLRYERSVLEALGEVENSLIACREQRLRLEALERAVAASRRASELALRLYDDGLEDFQPVLDAQLDLVGFENAAAATRGDAAASLVRLFKAIGGGWDPGEVAESAPAQDAGDDEIPPPKEVPGES